MLVIHAEEVNYENDWIVDFGYSNLRIEDIKKLQNTS